MLLVGIVENMARVHLFEFGDLAWFPQVLREAETTYLSTCYRLLPTMSRRWAELIATALPAREDAEILDLCSGSGGAMPAILDELVKLGYDARATLTDLFPSPESTSHPRVTWLRDPVDARFVPAQQAGVLTMFSAFHHFRPHDAKAILKGAFDARRAICIFESGAPASLLTVGMMAGVPLAVLLLMPFSRPLRWGYILFTYLIPLLPFIVLWDGMVSLLRVYSPEQLTEMTEDLQATDYSWEIGEIRLNVMPGVGLPYLIGRPVQNLPA